MILPWKRPEDEELCDRPLKQSEFPAWASNNDYVKYYSPTNTYLGQLYFYFISFPIINYIFEIKNRFITISYRFRI